MAFAIQSVLENEYDRLDTMVRIMAPMLSAKIKNPTTTREARHKAVIEDERQKRARESAAMQEAVIDAALADLASLGFEVEVESPFSAPVKRGR